MPNSPRPPRRTALVVDDFRDTADLRAELLDTCGFNTSIAHDGEQALHDVPLYREFARLDGVTSRLPDETMILRFRHLLERHNLAVDMLRLRDRFGDAEVWPQAVRLIFRSLASHASGGASASDLVAICKQSGLPAQTVVMPVLNLLAESRSARSA